MELKVGTVVSNYDITQTGLFEVVFEDSGAAEQVQYVSPYGGSNAAFIAIPNPGNRVLVGYEPSNRTSQHSGLFYLGSVMGALPGVNYNAPIEENKTASTAPPTPITGVPTNSQDPVGPPIPKGQLVAFKDATGAPNPYRAFPDQFTGLYGGRMLAPEMIGLTSNYGDSLLISNRYRSGDKAPFQDHRVELKSGAGKSVACVDSPTVDAVVISNENKAKDYILLSSGNRDESPFAKGEFHLRTHGPINQYTLESNMHFWVEDGRNIEIENKAGGQYTTLSADDPLRKKMELPQPVGDQDVIDRIYEVGDETYGCVKAWSDHNNISVSAMGDDSVIHLHTSGVNTKVIIHSAGTVDIVADDKITLQSKTEVEINAPVVDINGKDFVYVDGGQVHLNKPHTPDPNWEF